MLANKAVAPLPLPPGDTYWEPFNVYAGYPLVSHLLPLFIPLTSFYYKLTGSGCLGESDLVYHASRNNRPSFVPVQANHPNFVKGTPRLWGVSSYFQDRL